MLIVAYLRDERFLARVPFQFKLDPKLIEMDRLLDDPKLVLQVSNNLIHSAPQAAWNGRPSTPAEVTLRIGVARRWMGWSYETTHDEIAGDAKWRWFCRLYDHPVPGHSAIQGREQLIQPATLHRLNDRVVRLARANGVTTGKKFRGDSTVIETNIHYPTDSRLLCPCLGTPVCRSASIAPTAHGDRKEIFSESVTTCPTPGAPDCATATRQTR
jgi:IS5 family transposase